MSAPVPRILGVGYHVPAQVRGNDAPIFDWLKTHVPNGSSLFEGYVERRVLGDGEDLMTLMVPAAQAALQDAGVEAKDIDLLLGCGSVSPFSCPNELGRLHHALGLPEHAWVVPLNNELSNFNAGLMLADSLLRAGRARHVLVAAGGNWTRHVNYHTPQAISAGDGAGAAVLGVGGADRAAGWELVDHHTITRSDLFGTMYMQGEPEGDLWSTPWFHITEAGLAAFKTFGMETAPRAVLELLARNGLRGADVALIGHQASTVLLQAWQQAIQPAQLVQTLARFANVTVANIPLTLAWARDNVPITRDHLVLLGLGIEMHANALLLRRGQAVA